MENIESQAPNTTVIEATETTINASPMGGTFEKGGFLDSFKELKWANILVASLLVVASVYSIYSNKQLLQNLNEEEEYEDDNVFEDIDELKYNLKRVMGRNYVVRT